MAAAEVDDEQEIIDEPAPYTESDSDSSEDDLYEADEKAVEARVQLQKQGIAEFVDECKEKNMSAKDILTLFAVPQRVIDVLGEEYLWQACQQVLSREMLKRPRLTHINTFEDTVSLIEKSERIIVVTGAGISTSLGIPDFRSKDGIYAKFNLEEHGLSDPQELFDIDVFRTSPEIFYSFAKKVFPETKKFSPTHAFIRLLQDKGKLLRNYTQNIDNIESYAGVRPEKLVQCHGSFGTASCLDCQTRVPITSVQEQLEKGTVPYCAKCTQQAGMGRLETHQRKRRKTDPYHEADGESDQEQDHVGLMKPDITFFGEKLPDEFAKHLVDNGDADNCDLLICIGTSLKVAPVSKIITLLPRSTPQIYIGREDVKHFDFDVSLLAERCDQVCMNLAMSCRWLGEFDRICRDVSSCHGFHCCPKAYTGLEPSPDFVFNKTSRPGSLQWAERPA